jgi:Flp pilus assembly protein TadB
MFPKTPSPGKSVALVAFLLAAFSAAPALAYVGPGAGLTALGSLVAVIAVAVLAVIGFLWYPLKRVMRRRKEARTEHLE